MVLYIWNWSTCGQQVQSAHFPADNLLDPVQELDSICAFIKRINDDICLFKCIKNLLKSVVEGINGWLLMAIFAHSVQLHQRGRHTITLVRELQDEGSDEIFM